MSYSATDTATVAAPPDAVFSLIVDPRRLPQWNRAIPEVLEAPAQLAVGSIWKVRIHAMGGSWVSRSQVAELDPATRRFAYRSQSDDGNPSYADWAWQVEPGGDGGSVVTVAMSVHPKTFWRRFLIVRIRWPGLRNEVRVSLASLGQFAESTA